MVERIVDQFWKVVYGIPRRSQKVTRSVTGSRSVLARSTGDQFEQVNSTFAFFGEQKVGLCGGREVGHTVASVQKHRALAIRQSSVWLYLQGFVMPEVARKRP